MKGAALMQTGEFIPLPFLYFFPPNQSSGNLQQRQNLGEMPRLKYETATKILLIHSYRQVSTSELSFNLQIKPHRISHYSELKH